MAAVVEPVRLRFRAAGEEGPFILLVHGAGASSLTWLRALCSLGRRARALAPDLPGHGQTTEGAAPGIESYREALRAFALAQKLPRPWIAGHSMGGAVAIDYALAYPGEVAGLVLCATAARLPVDPGLLELIEHRFAGFHRAFAAEAFGSGLLPGDALAAARDLLTAPRAVVLADFRACASYDAGHRLADLRLPTLVLAGAQDRVTPPALARELAGGIAGARFVEVPEAGHMLPWEQPARVAHEILGFLERT